MNVTCPGCSTVFRVDPTKVPAGGVRARCSVCRAVFRVESEPATNPPPAPAPSADRGAVEHPGARAHRPARAADSAGPRARRPACAGVSIGSRRRLAARSSCRRRRHGRPAGTLSAAPPQAAPLTCGRRSPPGPVSIATPPAPRTSSPRPSVNPFLSKDPEQKARRLARALVSDIVVYHPEKRLEGLRHGTLKQIFDEEIKKSWEEYAGQVGRELADSTTHFNDALNEILGDGSKIF